MNAYMATYVDDDMDDEVGIPAHLLTAQHQRWTILAYFQPICNLFSRETRERDGSREQLID